MATLPRLDILLYAHDGRGLGHASRTIAIGMALRRLSPHLKILFVSGCKFSQELIFQASLDWLKLPSYETKVTNGKSQGITGNSNYTDSELGQLRAQQLLQLIELYKPRLILADHSPQGKHKELLPSLEYTKTRDTAWVLGVRGIVGQVSQIKSGFAADVFQNHYTTLLWYGDSTVLGNTQLQKLKDQFDIDPFECGYVSRINEISATMGNRGDKSAGDQFNGTISIPWIGERSDILLERLYRSLLALENYPGKWQLFLDKSHEKSDHYFALFESLPHCNVKIPGPDYLQSLLKSKCAIIYGGYNSLIDVLSLSLPSLVITREMQDNEQQYHLAKLKMSTGNLFAVVTEDADESLLNSAINSLLQQDKNTVSINLAGAEHAATHLISLLQ